MLQAKGRKGICFPWHSQGLCSPVIHLFYSTLILSVDLEGIVQPTISNSSHLLPDGKYFLSRCLLNDGLGPGNSVPVSREIVEVLCISCCRSSEGCRTQSEARNSGLHGMALGPEYWCITFPLLSGPAPAKLLEPRGTSSPSLGSYLFCPKAVPV